MLIFNVRLKKSASSNKRVKQLIRENETRNRWAN